MIADHDFCEVKCSSKLLPRAMPLGLLLKASKLCSTHELFHRPQYCADADGKLTGGDAVKFFERSGLSRDLLAKVISELPASTQRASFAVGLSKKRCIAII
jgi:hypothetical protein